MPAEYLLLLGNNGEIQYLDMLRRSTSVTFIAVFETAVYRLNHLPHFTKHINPESLHLFCPECWGGRSTAWGGGLAAQ